jgi:hypothetical protein
MSVALVAVLTLVSPVPASPEVVDFARPRFQFRCQEPLTNDEADIWAGVIEVYTSDA